jgi:hypothetical protein
VIARLVALLALCAVLGDASACLVDEPDIGPRANVPRGAPPPGATGEPLAMSPACPCGCDHHGPTLAGVGLGQVAALPAESELPRVERPVAPRAETPLPPSAPVRAIDHVPIVRA